MASGRGARAAQPRSHRLPRDHQARRRRRAGASPQDRPVARLRPGGAARHRPPGRIPVVAAAVAQGARRLVRGTRAVRRGAPRRRSRDGDRRVRSGRVLDDRRASCQRWQQPVHRAIGRHGAATRTPRSARSSSSAPRPRRTRSSPRSVSTTRAPSRRARRPSSCGRSRSRSARACRRRRTPRARCSRTQARGSACRRSAPMSIAQQLYEGVELGSGGSTGLITYMRTNSIRISDDAKDAARKHITTAVRQGIRRQRCGARQEGSAQRAGRARGDPADRRRAAPLIR